jgi:hypothetical protein
MGGLILLTAFAAWIAVCISIATRLVRQLPAERFKSSVAILVFAVLFLLPISDEVVGRYQLSSLCRQGAVLKINAESIRGKSIRLSISPSNQLLPSTAIPILHSHYSYREATTGAELAQYDVYTARGGAVARWMQFPEGGHPLTIPSATCVPEYQGLLSKRFDFTLLN